MIPDAFTPLETAVCIAGLLFGAWIWIASTARRGEQRREDRAMRLADCAFTQCGTKADLTNAEGPWLCEGCAASTAMEEAL